MEVADTKKLKALEAENARLKKMVADRDLELEVLNAFASFTVSQAVLEVIDGGRRDTLSRAGVTFEGSSGEWWVSPNWGLGVGAAFIFGRIGGEGDPNANWSVAGRGLLFSATFN